jgi:enamine deaminase RidA (YjgF/YER057c/UK114 family)
MTNQRKLIGVGISIVIILFLSACNNATSETQENTDLYDYDVEERIKELGLELRIPGAPVANYVNAVIAGDLVFMAGKGPRSGESSFITGKVGSDLTLEQGYEAARLAAIEQLSALKAEIGDLNRVVRIVKVLGMVNADPEFTDHSKVVNGFSDLMVEVFGERGKHARAAVGMSSLPLGFACEVEMVVQIRK